MEILMFLGKNQKQKTQQKLFADWKVKIKSMSPKLDEKSLDLLAEWAAESQIEIFQKTSGK